MNIRRIDVAKHLFMPGGDAPRSLGLYCLLSMTTVTGIAQAASPAPVNLAAAGRYVILAESGITDVPTSSVTGLVGVSPITGAADLLSCAEVKGHVLSVDSAGPAPCSLEIPGVLSTGILAMQSAYTDAASRTPDAVELAGGNIGGLVFSPGVYRWSTPVVIGSTITLQGKSNDVWIFQVAQTLDLATNQCVKLRGGALPRNVYWQVAGATTIFPGANFAGNILDATNIAVQTAAVVHGRLLAQTAVTLEMNQVSISSHPNPCP